MPWIVMDFKGGGMLTAIPVTDIIDLDDPLPERPGLYYMKAPFSARNDHPTDQFFRRVIERGNTGLFIDETLAVGLHNRGFAACCYAGRELNVPMIMCAQKPTNIDPLARSQATIIQTFNVDSADDRNELKKYIPSEIVDLDEPLPKYHSIWYSKPERKYWYRGPCDREAIIERIFDRLPPLEEDEPPPAELATQKRGRVKL